MSGPKKIRGNTEFRFPLYDVLTVADGIKLKKVTVGALVDRGSVLGPKRTDLIILSKL